MLSKGLSGVFSSTILRRHQFFGAWVFPVVTYGCDSWTIKEEEHRRTDAFKRWCWRRLLSVAGTARRSNQSILREINPEYLLEGLMLKLKLQYFGHMMRTADSEKFLMLGKIEGRRRGRQRMRWLDSITNAMDMNLGKLQKMLKDREAWRCCSPRGCKGADATGQLNNKYLGKY